MFCPLLFFIYLLLYINLCFFTDELIVEKLAVYSKTSREVLGETNKTKENIKGIAFSSFPCNLYYNANQTIVRTEIQ